MAPKGTACTKVLPENIKHNTNTLYTGTEAITKHKYNNKTVMYLTTIWYDTIWRNSGIVWDSLELVEKGVRFSDCHGKAKSLRCCSVDMTAVEVSVECKYDQHDVWLLCHW